MFYSYSHGVRLDPTNNPAKHVWWVIRHIDTLYSQISHDIQLFDNLWVPRDLNYVDSVYCECFFNTQLINQCTLWIYFVLLCTVSSLFLAPAIFMEAKYQHIN